MELKFFIRINVTDAISFISLKKHFKKNFQCYSQIPGVAYKFENTSFTSYKDNFKFMCDLPFVVYFDFETTTSSSLFLDNKKERDQLLLNIYFSHKTKNG